MKGVNVKNNYRKIRKKEKKDNDMNTDVAQLDRSNNKYYVLAFRNIQISKVSQLTSKLSTIKNHAM